MIRGREVILFKRTNPEPHYIHSVQDSATSCHLGRVEQTGVYDAHAGGLWWCAAPEQVPGRHWLHCRPRRCQGQHSRHCSHQIFCLPHWETSWRSTAACRLPVASLVSATASQLCSCDQSYCVQHIWPALGEVWAGHCG